MYDNGLGSLVVRAEATFHSYRVGFIYLSIYFLQSISWALCSPGWPHTLYVAKDVLELLILPLQLSSSGIAGVCITALH